MADDTLKGGPTPAEATFFFKIVQHMKNKADIDWEAVAESAGFKNAGVAKVRFGQIKRKYGLEGESPVKKAGKAPGDLPPTPTKVTKARKGAGGGRGRKAKKEEPEEDDDDVNVYKKEEKTEESVDIKPELGADGMTYF